VTPSDRWRRIEELFISALDIPPGKRDTFLKNACVADPELRLEVESLLARDPGEPDTVGPPAIACIIEGTAASYFDDQTPPDAMVGAELGSYRIIRELGRGGMGAVYLAVRADQTFEKQVAIKLVKRGVDTDAVLQRFWYERRILAGLEHPYIARLVDGGTSPDGRPYFVMEYVDGKPLDTYVRDKNLSISERCELFRKIAEAVSYAHRNLIIHRDIKPVNILVTPDGTPKLLDFGIARLLSIEPGERTITGNPDFPLTPEFASPEQARCEAVTTATDVYSLGATLRAVLPSGNPHDLATIICKATREEIDQRYASVADFSEDIRRYLSGLPILARQQTLAYQAGKFIHRHGAGVAVFALANLLIFGAITAIIWESRKAEHGRKEAEQRLSQAVEMADRTLKDVNTSIAELPGTTEARREIVRSTLDYLNRLAKDSDNDPRVLTALATAYIRVGDVLGNSNFPNLGDLAGSLATYQRALAVIGSLLADDPDDPKLQVLASQAHEGAATILSSQGHDSEAEIEYRQSVALADKALSRSPGDADLQNQALDAHYAFNMHRYTLQPEETQQDVLRLLPVAEKLAAAHPNDLDRQNALSEVYSLLGTAANRLGRINDALGYYRKAVVVREAIYQRNPRSTKIQRNLMIVYGHVGDMLGSPFTGCIGDYRGALQYYQKAATIAEDMRRTDPSDKRAAFDVGMIWTRIGASRQFTGDALHSNADLDHAIAQFEPLLAGSPGNATYARATAMAYEYRGIGTSLLGNRAAALIWYRKSLALTEGLLKSRAADNLARVQKIAVEGPMSNLLALDGNRVDAVRIADRMLQDIDQLKDPRRDIHVARGWWWYAQTYEAIHDSAAAAAAYEKSVEAWRKVIGNATISPYKQQAQDANRKAAQYRAHHGAYPLTQIHPNPNIASTRPKRLKPSPGDPGSP
jgi:serine/threonine protein kinase